MRHQVLVVWEKGGGRRRTCAGAEGRDAHLGHRRDRRARETRERREESLLFLGEGGGRRGVYKDVRLGINGGEVFEVQGFVSDDDRDCFASFFLRMNI